MQVLSEGQSFVFICCFESILSNDEKFKSNSARDVKCISDMIKWLIGVHGILLKTMPTIFDTVKKPEVKTTVSI